MPTSKRLCGLGVTEDFMEGILVLKNGRHLEKARKNISGRNVRELGISMVLQDTVWALASWEQRCVLT